MSPTVDDISNMSGVPAASREEQFFGCCPTKIIDDGACALPLRWARLGCSIARACLCRGESREQLSRRARMHCRPVYNAADDYLADAIDGLEKAFQAVSLTGVTRVAALLIVA